MDGNWEQMVPSFFQCYDSGILRFRSVISEVGIGTTQAEQLPKRTRTRAEEEVIQIYQGEA